METTRIVLYGILALVLLFVIYFVIVSQGKTTAITNGSTFPQNTNLKITNNTELSWEVYMVDASGNFNSIADSSGNAMVIYPNNYFVYPVTNQNTIEIFAGNDSVGEGIQSIYGTILKNENGLVNAAYWGSATAYTSIIETTTLPPSLITKVLRNSANPVTLISNRFTPPNSYAVVAGSSFPRSTFTLVNYNVQLVNFYVSSSRSSIQTWNTVSTNSTVSFTPPPIVDQEYIVIIAASATTSGVQGTILFNQKGILRITYLFGQGSLSTPSPIGMFMATGTTLNTITASFSRASK